MHRIRYQIRQISDEEIQQLDSRGDLLSYGIHHLHDDIYSCAVQEVSDDAQAFRDGKRTWSLISQLPGKVVTEGSVKDRHAKLPAGVRDKVMVAEVFTNASDVHNTLEIQRMAIEEFVGEVNGSSLVDFDHPQTILDEAHRLAHNPDSRVQFSRVPHAKISEDHIVKSRDVIPHRWQGEF